MSRRTLMGILALLAIFLPLILWLELAPVDPETSLPPPPPATASVASPPPPAAVAPAPRPRPAPPAPEPAAPAPAPPDTPESPPYDGPTGIALFPPPGTKKVLAGIIVPEDFELPPGYVRHYQQTDDGHRLPAILMFHPDFQPRDASGQAVPMPPNRLVPPELAPQGLPIQHLEPPDPQGAPD